MAELPSPRGRVRRSMRWLERALLSWGMALIALVIEGYVRRAVRRSQRDPAGTGSATSYEIGD